jgi:hypothetical protein
MAASTLFQTYSAYQTQKAENQRLDYQAAISRNNALAAKYEGDYAREMTDRKVAQQRQQVAQVVGKQRAAMGATGLTADSGSFMDLSLDSVEQGKLDELAILHEGDKAVWNAQIGANNANAQANLFEMSKGSPTMAAAGSLMSGAAQTGLAYYNVFGKKPDAPPKVDTTKGSWGWT